MSTTATSWAWDQKVKQNTKLLLLVLAENTDRLGNGDRLAHHVQEAERVCGFDSQATSKKHLSELTKLGLVIEKGDGYALPIPRPRLVGLATEISG